MARTAVIAALALVVIACGSATDPAVESVGVPAGETVSVAGWDVRIVGSRLDRATGEEPGREAYDVQMSAWFSGNGTTTFADDVAISARARSGTVYTPTVGECPGGLAVGDPVRPDQSIEGFVCFSIDPGDTASLQLILTPTDTSIGPVVLNTVTPAPSDADSVSTSTEAIGSAHNGTLWAPTQTVHNAGHGRRWHEWARRTLHLACLARSLRRRIITFEPTAQGCSGTSS